MDDQKLVKLSQLAESLRLTANAALAAPAEAKMDFSQTIQTLIARINNWEQ